MLWESQSVLYTQHVHKEAKKQGKSKAGKANVSKTIKKGAKAKRGKTIKKGAKSKERTKKCKKGAKSEEDRAQSKAYHAARAKARSAGDDEETAKEQLKERNWAQITSTWGLLACHGQISYTEILPAPLLQNSPHNFKMP